MRKYNFAILSAVCFGISPVLSRYGSLRGMPPFAGTALALGVAALVVYVLVRAQGKIVGFTRMSRSSQVYLMSTSICVNLGVLFYWKALTRETVSIVVTINSIYPLITIALAFLFLRREERLTLRLIVGTICVIGGVMIIVA